VLNSWLAFLPESWNWKAVIDFIYLRIAGQNLQMGKSHDSYTNSCSLHAIRFLKVAINLRNLRKIAWHSKS